MGRLERVDITLNAFAGLRIATVSTIGLLTIGSFVGYGGLGNLIKAGLERSTGRAEVVTASVLCVLLALVAEGGFFALQRMLTPWLRTGRGGRR